MTTTFEVQQARSADGKFTHQQRSNPHSALAAPTPRRFEFPAPDVVRYTDQRCARLADAMHRATGWPIVAVGDGPDGTVGWVHAGVQNPDGLIVDIEGAHSPSDWVERWGGRVDAYGADNEHYDADAVWVHTAADYGWAGAGTPFAHVEDAADTVHATATARRIVQLLRHTQ